MGCNTYTTGAVIPVVTSCIDYKSQKSIGQFATQNQAAQANVDFYAGVIDQACAIAIVASYNATPVTVTITGITKIAETATTEDIRIAYSVSPGLAVSRFLKMNSVFQSTAMYNPNTTGTIDLLGLPKSSTPYNFCIE